MLYSLKKETGHERPKYKSTIKKNYEIIPTTCCPIHTHSPITHNKYTMDTEFLVQMRQCNKCGSVRNIEIFNLHLGSGAGP